MLKILTTLVRGVVAEAEDAVFDANATRLLAQQLREAAEALEHSRKELACAMAHCASEERAAQAVEQRIADLEKSAMDAIAGGREDLAAEAAATIAALEDERRDRRAAIGKFNTDIARLKQLSTNGQKRLEELRRGLEMARAQEALHRAGANGRRAHIAGTGALREAEQTLVRIRQRQTCEEDTHAALEELERASSGKDLDQRLAEAGFGSKPVTQGQAVLDRLKARVAASAGSRPSSPGAGG